jgi:hypothetical protein
MAIHAAPVPPSISRQQLDLTVVRFAIPFQATGGACEGVNIGL